MQDVSAALTYAKALFQAVRGSKTKDFKSVGRDLHALNKLITSSQKLKADLQNPLIRLEDKKKMLEKQAGSELASGIVGRFVNLMIAKKRIELLPLVAARFEETVQESEGLMKASVKSASPLSEAGKKEIEAKLSGFFKKKVFIEVSVNPELLAGVVVKAGDLVIDGSLRNKLKTLKTVFTTT